MTLKNEWVAKGQVEEKIHGMINQQSKMNSIEQKHAIFNGKFMWVINHQENAN